jgi:hypothetical protein
MNIRLEYSQREGKFIQAQATDQTDVAKGYKTICCFVAVERATRFTQAIIIKYPELNSNARQSFPSFSTMKDELYKFITEDIKVLEEHMNTTFQRRVQLFNQL